MTPDLLTPDQAATLLSIPASAPARPRSRRCDRVRELAAVERIHFHALRHAALTLITEVAGQKAAQIAAGHANLSTTDIYATTTENLRRRAAEALEEAIG